MSFDWLRLLIKISAADTSINKESRVKLIGMILVEM